ncbi:hypothetical protein [Pseudonocardia spirodelae]|uniref:Uncharacterized protein n=1 Tax=Pseudonocardia spirodelae TaxID=3133431 RepID=A0ABU8TBD3_9PSEU
MTGGYEQDGGAGGDRTAEVAARLGVDPRVLAVVVAAGWRVADGHGGVADAPDGPRGTVYVGVPSPAELRALDLPADGLRHFGLTPADLRRGGWTDTDLRSAGLTPPGAPDATAWFVAGDPPQLMLGLDPARGALLARPELRRAGHPPVLDPADVVAVPVLPGCTDPDGDAALAVREVRDGLLRRARRRITHCALCLRPVLRDATTHGACHLCAGSWLGIVL